MNVTTKQRVIMNVIMEGNTNNDGVTISWCDIGQIRERLPYKSSREAVICSINYLAKKGLIEIRPRAEVRNGRRKTVYIPTNLAFDKLFRKPLTPDELRKLL